MATLNFNPATRAATANAAFAATSGIDCDLLAAPSFELPPAPCSKAGPYSPTYATAKRRDDNSTRRSQSVWSHNPALYLYHRSYRHYRYNFT